MLPEKDVFEKVVSNMKKQETAISCEVLNELKCIVENQYCDFMGMYVNGNLADLSKKLSDTRKIRKILKRELDSIPEQTVVLVGQYVQTYNIFNKLTQLKKRNINFAEELVFAIKKHSEAKRIIQYLYKHPNTQHEVICKELDIPRSTLSDVMLILEEIHCIIRISIGKYTLYELSDEARQFVKKNYNISIEEVLEYDIVEAFREEVRSKDEKNYKVYKNKKEINVEFRNHFRSSKRKTTNELSDEDIENFAYMKVSEVEWSEMHEKIRKNIIGVRK